MNLLPLIITALIALPLLALIVYGVVHLVLDEQYMEIERQIDAGLIKDSDD